jgi:hypothetical protein
MPTATLIESIAPLITDRRFVQFLGDLQQMRENAIMDLCNDAVLDNPNKIAATIGEIRCFSSILSLAGHLKQNSVDSNVQTDNPESTA